MKNSQRWIPISWPSETVSPEELRDFVESISDYRYAPGEIPGPYVESTLERETREFVEEITGIPCECKSQVLRIESTAERELREFVEQITGERSDSNTWPVQYETVAERDLREFVEDITGVREGAWDPAKHPRGAFAQNRGWFSPTGNSHRARSSSRAMSLPSHHGDPRRPRPANRQIPEPKPKPKVRANYAAYQPPPGPQIYRPGGPQPAQQRGVAVGQPGQQNLAVVAQPPTPFPGAPGLPAPLQGNVGSWQNSSRLDANGRQQSADLQKHVHDQVPLKIQQSMIARGVEIRVVPSLAEAGIVVKQNPAQPNQAALAPDETTGGAYDATNHIVYIPLRMGDGKPNPHLERNTRHEAGHIYDHLSHGSTSAEFEKAYRADLADGRPIRDTEIERYQPGGGRIGPIPADDRWAQTSAAEKDFAKREAFAEAFAEVTQPLNPQNQTTENFRRAESFRAKFKRTIEHVRQKVKNAPDEGLAVPGF
jgi:hypothetical protein